MAWQTQSIASCATTWQGGCSPSKVPPPRPYATIATSRRAAGRPIAQAHCQIAAIARARGATVATGNTADFEGCGVGLINPWDEAS